MIYLSLEAKKQINALCYYPHVFGKHLEKLNHDLGIIDRFFESLGLTSEPDKVRTYYKVRPGSQDIIRANSCMGLFSCQIGGIS